MRLKTILSFLLLMPAAAHAGVLDVSSPSVTKGAIGVEASSAWERTPDDFNHRLEASYGVTSFWKTAIELSADRAGGQQAEYAATTWKNTLKFYGQTDSMPVAIGMRLDYSHAHISGDADAVDARLLLQHKTGPWEARLNLGVEREIGDNAGSGVGGDVRASGRYTVADGYKLGIDYLGDTGTLHTMPAFDKQDHRVGPVLLADLGHGLGLETGYFAGVTDGAPDHSFKLIIDYGF